MERPNLPYIYIMLCIKIVALLLLRLLLFLPTLRVFLVSSSFSSVEKSNVPLCILHCIASSGTDWKCQSTARALVGILFYEDLTLKCFAGYRLTKNDVRVRKRWKIETRSTGCKKQTFKMEWSGVRSSLRSLALPLPVPPTEIYMSPPTRKEF